MTNTSEMYRNFPILIVDDELGTTGPGGRALSEIIGELEDLMFPVVQTRSVRDGKLAFASHADTGAILLDYDLEASDDYPATPVELIEYIRGRNSYIPIFILTERLRVEEIPLAVMEKVHGYIWKEEDTPRFIAGRVEQAAKSYLEYLLPPFFQRLVEYVHEHKYAWHTPGHGGGIAFIKSPAGKLFYDFFGENIFRADLCSSVPEMGSVLEHEGVVLEAEKEAARIFGADRTYFITNGTSTSNKIVFNACVSPGDVVLVDRNCHKSVIHSLILSGAIPVYLLPTRNAYGILGPVHSSEFDEQNIRDLLKQHPLIRNPEAPIRMAILTNTTYDGICYNTDLIKEKIRGLVNFILFDEAWMPYARFHPLFNHRYGMFGENDPKGGPGIFATQSAHKLLAAFSQASMIHVRDHHMDEAARIPHRRFNEAFMIHTSTSPQYTMIASLDVSAKMMEGVAGRGLMEDTISDAITFRKRMLSLRSEIGDREAPGWWFEVWQPDVVTAPESTYGGRIDGVPFSEVDSRVLENVPACWDLSQHGEWHGIEDLAPSYVMLDPTKVTILTPGIGRGVTMDEEGIPAVIVTTFLRTKGVVVEKTNFYSFLVLFSIANTRGRSSTLIAALFEFKALYDCDAPLSEVFPGLVRDYPETYHGMTLKQLCHDMHQIMGRGHVTTVQSDIYRSIPQMVMPPAGGYAEFVRGTIELVPLDEARGRISGVLIVIYPPGIPIINPGERFGEEQSVMIDFLKIFEENDNRFPGFGYEMQGIVRQPFEGRMAYHMYVIRE
jgi:arginine decarboxylase